MIKWFLGLFGFIHKDDICKVATNIYIDHSVTGRGINAFYFDCGNCNALNALCSRLNIDLTTSVKRENFKKVYGGEEA